VQICVRHFLVTFKLNVFTDLASYLVQRFASWISRRYGPWSLAFEDLRSDQSDKNLLVTLKMADLACAMDIEIMAQGRARWDDVLEMRRVPTMIAGMTNDLESAHPIPRIPVLECECESPCNNPFWRDLMRVISASLLVASDLQTGRTRDFTEPLKRTESEYQS
jgi:hypothetical protein